MASIAEDRVEKATRLIHEGYHQISAKYGILAKLPDGHTGVDALIDACLSEWKQKGSIRPEYWPKHYREWARGLGERVAADHFRRVYAEGYGLTVTVDQATLKVFRACGGLKS